MLEVDVEAPNPYDISIFSNEPALGLAIRPFTDKGFDLMQKRAKFSSVPSFLGGLIDGVRKEVEPVIPLRLDLAPKAGGSDLLKTVDEETAFRVYRRRFPSELTAKYALTYGTAIASAKVYNRIVAEADTAAEELQERFIRETPTLAEIEQAEFETEDLAQAVDIATYTLRYYGGLTLFIENFAEGPDNLLIWPLHMIKTIMHGYPNPISLYRVRRFVDNHFNETAHMRNAKMDAIRFRIPLSSS